MRARYDTELPPFFPLSGTPVVQSYWAWIRTRGTLRAMPRRGAKPQKSSQLGPDYFVTCATVRKRCECYKLRARWSSDEAAKGKMGDSFLTSTGADASRRSTGAS